MKVIINKILPPKRFKAIALFPFIFTRVELNNKSLNHEKIHLQQQKELLIIPFFILYILFTCCYTYKRNPFEKEAYANAKDYNYLAYRKRFSWIKYFKR